MAKRTSEQLIFSERQLESSLAEYIESSGSKAVLGVDLADNDLPENLGINIPSGSTEDEIREIMLNAVLDILLEKRKPEVAAYLKRSGLFVPTPGRNAKEELDEDAQSYTTVLRLMDICNIPDLEKFLEENPKIKNILTGLISDPDLEKNPEYRVLAEWLVGGFDENGDPVTTTDPTGNTITRQNQRIQRLTAFFRNITDTNAASPDTALSDDDKDKLKYLSEILDLLDIKTITDEYEKLTEADKIQIFNKQLVALQRKLTKLVDAISNLEILNWDLVEDRDFLLNINTLKNTLAEIRNNLNLIKSEIERLSTSDYQTFSYLIPGDNDETIRTSLEQLKIEEISDLIRLLKRRKIEFAGDTKKEKEDDKKYSALSVLAVLMEEDVKRELEDDLGAANVGTNQLRYETVHRVSVMALREKTLRSVNEALNGHYINVEITKNAGAGAKIKRGLHSLKDGAKRLVSKDLDEGRKQFTLFEILNSLKENLFSGKQTKPLIYQEGLMGGWKKGKLSTDMAAEVFEQFSLSSQLNAANLKLMVDALSQIIRGKVPGITVKDEDKETAVIVIESLQRALDIQLISTSIRTKSTAAIRVLIEDLEKRKEAVSCNDEQLNGVLQTVRCGLLRIRPVTKADKNSNESGDSGAGGSSGVLREMATTAAKVISTLKK